jgi:hypothetical protein
MTKTFKSGTSPRGARGPKAQSAKRPDVRRRAIMVLGMHRSGTSALTGVINLLGADLPSNLMPADPSNERGFFESNDLMVIHDELLKSAGSDWQDWRAFNPNWYTSPAAAVFKERVLGVLRRDCADSQLFVIKDPRACRFFPFWRDVLKEFGAVATVAIPVRNPLEVMASLRGRSELPVGNAALLWLRHSIDAERATRDLPRAVVTYDNLLSDPHGVVASLGARLGVSWPRRGAATDLEIGQFLATRLRHHVATPESLAARAEIVDWVKDAYTALLQLSLTPGHQASKARLDRIRAEFDKASVAFGVAPAESQLDGVPAPTDHAQAVEEVRPSWAEHDALKETLERADWTLSAVRQRVAEQADELAELARDRERAEAGRAAAAEEVRRLRAELGVQARIAADQSGMIGRFHAIHARAEQECAALGRRIGDLETEVVRLSGENSGLAARLERRIARTAWLESDLRALNRIVETSSASAAARAAALQIELSAATRRAVEMEASYHRANGQLLAIKRAPGWGLLSSIRRITAPATTRADQRLIARSGLFDRDWYVANYPEIKASALDPLLDYLLHGAAEARDPGPLFCGGWYLERYPDVRATGINPLVHFLRYGAREGRNPSPLFETEWYRARHPDVSASGINALVHYVRCGAAEGRDPGPYFDTKWYLAANPDVKAAKLNPLAHYLQFGIGEGRKPNPAGEPPPFLAADAGTRRWATDVVRPKPIDRYAVWLACNEFREPARRGLRSALAARGERLPRISVIMPVYNTPRHLLDQAIGSVVDQVYEGWELCIADDSSTATAVAEILEHWAAADHRIHIVRLSITHNSRCCPRLVF